MTFRVRCEVLKVIAICDGATSKTVCDMLPDLEAKQVQKAIYQLLTQDRIFKTGKQQRHGSNGRPLFEYQANEDWEPATKAKKVKREKTGRKTYSEELRTNGGGITSIIRFRDRKVRLLGALASKASGTNKDLLIGILADFGHKYHE